MGRQIFVWSSGLVLSALDSLSLGSCLMLWWHHILHQHLLLHTILFRHPSLCTIPSFYHQLPHHFSMVTALGLNSSALDHSEPTHSGFWVHGSERGPSAVFQSSDSILTASSAAHLTVFSTNSRVSLASPQLGDLCAVVCHRCIPSDDTAQWQVSARALHCSRQISAAVLWELKIAAQVVCSDVPAVCLDHCSSYWDLDCFSAPERSESPTAFLVSQLQTRT